MVRYGKSNKYTQPTHTTIKKRKFEFFSFQFGSYQNGISVLLLLLFLLMLLLLLELWQLIWSGCCYHLMEMKRRNHSSSSYFCQFPFLHVACRFYFFYFSVDLAYISNQLHISMAFFSYLYFCVLPSSFWHIFFSCSSGLVCSFPLFSWKLNLIMLWTTMKCASFVDLISLENW